jgi:hypothetical protein
MTDGCSGVEHVSEQKKKRVSEDQRPRPRSAGVGADPSGQGTTGGPHEHQGAHAHQEFLHRIELLRGDVQIAELNLLAGDECRHDLHRTAAKDPDGSEEHRVNGCDL